MSAIYEDGSYLAKNPDWHEEDSPWKARQIGKIMEKNFLHPKTVCEIGCGAGGILSQMAKNVPDCDYVGYDISPQAIELCRTKTSANLTFRHEDLLKDDRASFDVVMAIDVFEHVEDYFGFLRKLKEKAEYKIFHIPLDLSVQTVIRSSPILRCRSVVGHIHYFTKETALESLKDTGYSVVDYCYTAGSLDLPNRSWQMRVLALPRKIAFFFNRDLAVRWLGGYSLLVLAK